MLLLFLAEAEPEELELELGVSAPLATEPRVLKGETGEARSSSRKSGLFSSQLSESWSRVVKESKLEISCMGFAECDMSYNQFAKKCLWIVIGGWERSVGLAIVCVKNTKNELCNSRESERKT